MEAHGQYEETFSNPGLSYLEFQIDSHLDEFHSPSKKNSLQGALDQYLV